MSQPLPNAPEIPWPLQPIQALFFINSGMQLGKARAAGADKGHCAITMTDLDDSGVIWLDARSIAGFRRFSGAPPSRPELQIQNGDLLLNSRGAELRSAFVVAPPEPAEISPLDRPFVGPNMLLLRPRIDPEGEPFLAAEALQAWIRSDLGARTLLAHSGSAVMKVALNIRDLAAIQVPVPPKARQRAIVDLMRATNLGRRAALEAARLRFEIGARAAAQLLFSDVNQDLMQREGGT